MVHGELWTLKDLFVYPNEYIYWGIQIVMYPFMTGLVAGAFVLSSLYHVFGIKKLKDIARFSLVFSFALLFVAPLPLLLHLQQPTRCFEVFLTPHFTSAIAAFGIIFSLYGSLVATELWFLYRKHFVETSSALKSKRRSIGEHFQYLFFTGLTLGAFDVSEKALEVDKKAIKILAGIGIPVACFLHGYAGFIFGSVKANALWMTPLMPVIFIVSAIVSGIALCLFTYIIAMEMRKFFSKKNGMIASARTELAHDEMSVVRITAKYLLGFLIGSISLELLDLVFRGYTAVKSWDVLRSIIYGMDFKNIFIFQYGIGNLIPFILLLFPRLGIKRALVSLALVLFGVFMMRWNVVIGGQAFSLSFAGYMHYRIPIIPTSIESYKEGLFGALTIGVLPFVLFIVFMKIFPVFKAATGEPSGPLQETNVSSAPNRSAGRL